MPAEPELGAAGAGTTLVIRKERPLGSFWKNAEIHSAARLSDSGWVMLSSSPGYWTCPSSSS